MALSREGLLGFMKKELGVNVAKINDESPLFSAGVIDSHMLLSLITYIEGETGLRISTGDLSLENFDTLGRMLAFAARKQAEK
jgi:acyl carrier protein